MSHWNHQNMDKLQKQAVKRLVAAELELMAARSVLSEIEKVIVSDHLLYQCNVVVGKGICILDLGREKTMNVIVEKIHPIASHNGDHVQIEFRAFTAKGKPCKTTSYVSFDCLPYFKKGPQGQC